MLSNLSMALPVPLVTAGYRVRIAKTDQDLHRAQALRHGCFVEAAGRPSNPDALEKDRFDARCGHVLIEDEDDRLICCYRVEIFDDFTAIKDGYSAQFYGLDGLESLADAGGAFLELGRFCVAKDTDGADVLRLAWGMLAQIVDLRGVAMIFGCSSFAGCDPDVYGDAFALLASKFVSDRISVAAPETIKFTEMPVASVDHGAALAQVPPLLRSYLAMGGWVSDHAVIDREMNTLHVFTGLEVAAIPKARARALRAIAREASSNKAE